MEVCASTHGVGVFATRDYSVGDCVLDKEAPLALLAPSSDEQEQGLLLKWSNSQKAKDSTTLWSILTVPSTVPQQFHGKFKGMIQAGLCFETLVEKSRKESIKTELLKLYYPTERSASTPEKDIILVSQEAVDYLSGNLDLQTPKSILQKIMLVWTCNSFQGGRIYKEMSRFNHSCNPNSIIQPHGDNQTIVAAAPISKGEEITISYLGLFVYAELPWRRALLKKTKHFICECERCQSEQNDSTKDKASRVPCPDRHPRLGDFRQLDEDTQYDDDGGVSYTSGWSIEADSNDSPKNDMAGRKSCGDDSTAKENYQKLAKAMQQVREKVGSYLESKQNGDSRHNDDLEVEAEVLEQHLRLASAVMGAKHWTTNQLLLIQLDETLHSFHNELLTNDKPPDMSELAEAIDMLQRLVAYVGELGLKLDMGHLLSSVMIGTARALVSLGDVKSQKYAVEWVDPIKEYVKHFEPEGMQKVVGTIANAWKVTAQSEGKREPTKSKKAKLV